MDDSQVNKTEQEQDRTSHRPQTSAYEECIEMASKLYLAGKFAECANKCSEHLPFISDPLEKAKTLIWRSKAFCSLSRWILSQSPARGEKAPFYGQDPSYYASMAKEDAITVQGIAPGEFDASFLLGEASFLLEDFEAAEEAYRLALKMRPDDAKAMEGLEAVQKIRGEVRPAGGKRVRGGDIAWDSDLECTLCMEMLYEPVTTPCGHTFCRACFSRAMDHNSRCPMCRVVLHVGRKLPVTTTLKNILVRNFPEKYEERRLQEEAATQAAADGPVPLFVMALLFPGERMALNIFEPRYRLMVRRCMEGSHCFGMAASDPSTGELLPVACEVEIVECQSLPDGRYGLEVVGRRRFRIESEWQQDGYRMVQPEYFADSPLPPESPDHAELQAMAEQAANTAEGVLSQARSRLRNQPEEFRPVYAILARIGQRPRADDVEALSFWAAALCFPSSDRERVKILEQTNTSERIKRVNELLSQGVSGQRCVVQ